MLRYTFILLSLAVFTPFLSQAQRKVKLEHADELRGIKVNGERVDRLKGNVVFKQNTTTIFCDSSYFYKSKNTIEAFGRVKILEGDSVTITSNRLEYDGNTKKAKLRSNVVFTKLATATLYTDNLDYERNANRAYYFNGGKLVDSINVLTSTRGHYNVNSNLASFKKKVHVVNPDYVMDADSLQYNSKTKIIYFVTETTVTRKDSSVFVYDRGQYDTRKKLSVFDKGEGESVDYKVNGLKYDGDAIREIYKIRGNVVMTSKKEKLIIYGQASDYYKAKGYSKIYDRAYIAKITDDQDTIFITADTLVSIESKDPAKKRLLAYNHVKIYKSDMQGLADSLEYRVSDSTLYMYKNPVLWNQGNQMTADSISMLIKNNRMDKLFLVSNSFVISQDTILNFNQIKGRRMTAQFKGDKMDNVYVEGNGESVYFALDDKNNGVTGMNKIICSNIRIRFKDGKVNNFTFLQRPEAEFIPPHELKIETKTLKGFAWKVKEKPSREDVVHPQITQLPSN